MRRSLGTKQQKEIKKASMLLLLLFSLILASLMGILMYHFTRQTNELYDSMVHTVLLSEHTSQLTDVENSIEDAQDFLSSIANIYSSIENSSDNNWKQSYLDACEGTNDLQGLRYYALENPEELHNFRRLTANGTYMLDELRAGKKAVSDAFFNKELDNQNVLAICVPVQKSGEVIGFLRGLMPTEKLLASNLDTDEYSIHNYLMDQNGNLVFGNDNGESSQTDLGLWKNLEQHGASTKEIAQTQKLFAASTGTHTLLFKNLQSEEIFLMVSPLGCNDWRLCSFCATPKNAQFVISVTRSTETIIQLMLFFILVFIVLFLIFYRKEQTKIMATQARYDLLSQFTDTILMDYDCKARKLRFTPNISKQFQVADGMTEFEPFRTPFPFDTLHAGDVAALRDLILRAESGILESPHFILLRFLHKDGTYHIVRWRCLLIEEASDSSFRLIGKIVDIQEEAAKEQRLIREATLDPLTGIRNRKTVQANIEQRLENTDHGYLLLIDVDNFKHVNDEYGHFKGDEVLRYFANILQEMPIPPELIGRYGGDEFLAFIPGDLTRADVSSICLNFLSNLDDGSDITLTSSIGIAAYPKDGKNFEELCVSADTAMYHIKKTCKNSYYFAS